jgi:hypothetical protein
MRGHARRQHCCCSPPPILRLLFPLAVLGLSCGQHCSRTLLDSFILPWRTLELCSNTLSPRTHMMLNSSHAPDVDGGERIASPYGPAYHVATIAILTRCTFWTRLMLTSLSAHLSISKTPRPALLIGFYLKCNIFSPHPRERCVIVGARSVCAGYTVGATRIFRVDVP